MLKLNPKDTAIRMLSKYGLLKARDAVLDYRAHLHDPGTVGYTFWTNVLEYLRAHCGQKAR